MKTKAGIVLGTILTTILVACSATPTEGDVGNANTEADALHVAACNQQSILAKTDPNHQGIMQRAFTWVDEGVMYKQQPNPNYGGYRTDCSGFVSMAWDLNPPGLVSQTFHKAEHPITWDELSPGDALVWPSDHVMLFAGWLDDKHTEFCTLEEYYWGHPASILHHKRSNYESDFDATRIDTLPTNACYSHRLGHEVKHHVCVQRTSGAWHQCADGVWIEGKASAGACVTEMPL